MMRKFVDLNRSFALIPRDHEFKEDDYDLSISFGLLETKKWSDLFQLRRVIILAEAGAGKTEEIRAATERLRDDGRKAFFFRLEHLSSNFETSFEIGNNAEFKEWLSSDESGYFFLDSVDEARLCGPKQFEAAIRNFGVKLGYSKQRVHLFITSRFSEWRAQSDLSFVKDQIPFIEFVPTTEEHGKKKLKAEEASFSSGFSSSFSGGGERKPAEPSVFSLCPLDQEQIKTFSQAFSIQDLDAFIKAIQRAEADIFSRRPLDLVELINYWTEFGKIANRAALIEASISSKLNETDPDRADVLPLTIEEAALGAEMLAAAVTFQRKDRILVPEQNPDPMIKTGSLDIQCVLTNWHLKQVRALLQRPIFDEAIYGTVRFHHRIVREYLIAKWLHRLLLNGKPRCAIENLFFKERYGRMVLVPSMRPILAWLILFDDRIQEKTAKIAPEVFIQGGDPSALPTDVRKNMLEKFCLLYSDQKVTDLSFNISDVRRFVHSDLSETINHLLDIYSNNEEIRELLLRMVWQGELQGCSKKALTFALNNAFDNYTHMYGIRAIETAGSNDQKIVLVDALINDPAFKNAQLIGELITAFTPDILSVHDVLSLIQRMEKSERHSESWMQHSLKEYSQHRCLDADIVEWIRGLFLLLKQAPVIKRRFFEVSVKNSWLLPFAVLAVERVIRIKHPNAIDDSVLRIILLAQAAVSFGTRHVGNHALAELVPKWSRLNRALFWFDVAASRKHKNKKKEERLISWWQIGFFNHFWHFTENNFEEILADINKKSYMDDRLVALSLAFQLYKENGRGRARRLLLKKAVCGVPELEDTLKRYLKPLPMSDHERQLYQKQSYLKRKQKQQQKKKADNRREWREWLQAHTDILRDTSLASKGTVWRATVYLLQEYRDKQDRKGKWVVANWEELIPEFGRDVAEAYRDGCMDYWRKYRPEIRSEGIESSNSTPYAVIVGLLGIDMEARHTIDWPRNLSNDDAILACRYAFHELNGFPNWLSKLHTVFPDVVEASILAEIEWEFSQYDADANCHYVLDDVVWHGEWLKPKISSRIISFLKDYEPKHDDTARKALEIVLVSLGLDEETLVEIAKTKVLKVTSVNRQALWLAVWMCIDAIGAFEALISILDNITDPERATELSVLFINSLLGERHKPAPSVYQDYNKTEILLPLIKLMYKHIRIAEDIDRTGTYDDSPNFRDNAQDARNRLFQLLCDIPGKPTYLAMMDLAQHHPDEKSRQWYSVHAKRRAEADAEAEPWHPGDIALFAEDAERAPQNHRELYDLAVLRLLDLKADLEDGDTSLAEILVTIKDETKYRNLIGGWLRDHSFGRYSVPQEEELADAKKPDIRIHGVGFDGPVPIELKIVDNNWSGAKLVERLHNQLCGQYLRDVRSNCGIFMLVYRGEKKYWEHPYTGKHLDFCGLIRLLEGETEKITTKDNKVESIKIVGIDLTKRTISKVKKF